MEVQFIGAAQTVTGSMHLVRTKHGAVLLDCGLYQGRRREAYERNKNLPVPVKELVAVVLSHAHIDHSGALPMLARAGYRGPIFATPATRDLATVMLQDSALIQQQDVRYLNRHADEQGLERAEALYDEKDVLKTIQMFHSVPYGFKSWIGPELALTFYDAGHVLGSAIAVLEAEGKRLAFTGDLGRTRMPILQDPQVPENIDALITESTYGDRLHDSIDKMDDDLAAVVERTYARGGKVIIPSFALERAQEIVLALKNLRQQKRLPKLKVYVDSPLTVKITDIFKLHPECYDPETLALIQSGESPFDFSDLKYIESVDDSKIVSASTEPSIVIAASGMCEAGRILHHLKACVEDPKNTVLIVGYQAQHTLGRRLVEKQARVRIFGVERERRCDVVVLNGFSAHADQNDLLTYVQACRDKGPLTKLALVHGDPKPQKTLADKLVDRGLPRAFIPAPMEKMVV
jgi:metallo-beta-lactamase family protein